MRYLLALLITLSLGTVTKAGEMSRAAFEKHMVYIEKTLDGMDPEIFLPAWRKTNPRKASTVTLYFERLCKKSPSGRAKCLEEFGDYRFALTKLRAYIELTKTTNDPAIYRRIFTGYETISKMYFKLYAEHHKITPHPLLSQP